MKSLSRFYNWHWLVFFFGKREKQNFTIVNCKWEKSMFNRTWSLTFGLHILWGKSKSNHRVSQSARAKSTIHLCGMEGFQWISYHHKARWHSELETFLYSHANLKFIYTRKVSHLAFFWKWEFLWLRNDPLLGKRRTLDSSAQRTQRHEPAPAFCCSASSCSCFWPFCCFEIAFMDNQAKITGVFSLLDSETVSW